MNVLNPQPLDGEKPLRVRRGRVESVDLYEIKGTELDHFEYGAPGDLQFNFAIFLLSTAFSSVCALATATFDNKTIESAFLFVAVIGITLGAYLVISWWRSRTPTKALCKKIRDRIQPEQGGRSAIGAADPDPDPDPDEPPPPVG
ncbi:hypothetical protein [Xanthomonas arboricola]|uniref:hypothetical protein n=1 Tax=Xanthomonas arboricola TaxID=56448 RepID=UPI0012904621|nr:hypothetical protein [Xanthomonas arboricola]